MTGQERQALRDIALRDIALEKLSGAELYRVLSLIDGPFKDDPVRALGAIRGYIG